MTIANHQTGECSLPDCFCHEAQRLLVGKTAFSYHLDKCTVCALVAKQFPDLELFDHQLCPQGRQLFRNPSVITVPTFEQEWQDAPKWATRYTEQEVAQWWFIRGQHAKEVELLTTMNCDLKRWCGWRGRGLRNENTGRIQGRAQRSLRERRT